jgi:riboflavin synthase
MFTGLIDTTGTIRKIDASDQGSVIEIATTLAPGLKHGDSVSVNGVCLTATNLTDESFSAEVMLESLNRTALSQLETQSLVNLELPLTIGDRLDGHIVQGHVDGVGEVQATTDSGFSRVIRVRTPGDLAKYVVEKGSIAIDGVSLTVSAIGNGSGADELDEWLEVSLIPETLERTTLGSLQQGDKVNLEADVLAKHVERLLQHPSTDPAT